MRVPLEWLADYVAVEMPVDELAHRLTMTGLKVEAIERIGADWQDVVVGEVIELSPHPASTKPLHVARVSLGDRTITVVTGAQNLQVADRVPVVLVGGLLPHGPDGEPMIITAKPMAGITSEGMLASARELGISEEHAGIHVLPPNVPVGASLRAVLGGNVIDIETNPNRPDTLSIIGVAREVAAMTGQQLTLPDLDSVTGSVEYVNEESIEVVVEEPDLCPRYSALRIDGLAVGPSPLWLANRLEAAGMRAINLPVDITNYVMLEYGQPMHAFDAARLHGGRIVVRRADEGERLRTLDGVDRALPPESLVIADGSRAVAVAGVMGGEESEIGDETRSIILESANFDPISVRRTAQTLGLRTESSSRFERGLPPEGTILGLRRYLQLLAQVSEAPLRVARISDAQQGAPEPRTVEMPMRDLDRLLGIRVPQQRAAEVLSLLGFDVSVSGGSIRALVPFWRRADISMSADLVEEVARMIGYDEIPATLPNHTLSPPAPLPELELQDAIREHLLAAGVNEVVTGSLTSPAAMARLFPPGADGHAADSSDTWAALVPNPSGIYARDALTLPVPLLNPPTRDRTVMRLTLLPSLLDVVARNLKHTEEGLGFFEMARTFFRRSQDLPYERRTLTLVLTGRRTLRSWESQAPGGYTFYDVKGMLSTVLDALQIKDWRVEATTHAALHPGRGATLHLQGRDVAYLGELHPQVAAAFEIEGWPVQVAEIDLDTLFEAASTVRVFHPLPRFPAARRDIAVIVDADLPAECVLDVVRQAGGEVLELADIFDVYAGDQLAANRKSIAISMELRAPGATLTQEEIAGVMERIVGRLHDELNATLRE